MDDAENEQSQQALCAKDNAISKQVTPQKRQSKSS